MPAHGCHGDILVIEQDLLRRFNADKGRRARNQQSKDASREKPVGPIKETEKRTQINNAQRAINLLQF